MQAWAAEAAAEHAPEAFYATAEFWVAVGLVIFVAATFRTIYRVVTVALDDRAERIKSQIDEAARLATEAQELLASFERKQREASEEAEQIVEHARREASRLTAHAADDLEKSLKRREQAALERIAQAEAAAVTEVKMRAIEVGMAATQRVLAEQLKGKSADALIEAAIKELPKKLH